MSKRSLLVSSLAALLLAPAGCAATADDAPEPEEGVEQTEQAFITLPKPPMPDLSAMQLEAERAAALAKNGVAGADGFTRLVLAPKGEKPVVFQAANEAVEALANGFEVRGELTLDTPAGPLSFGSAEVVFEWGPDRTIGLSTVRGAVDVPFPGAGALQGVSVASVARGQIGYDVGSNLADVEAPIARDRHYLYVDTEAGLSATSGIVTFSAPVGGGLRALIDPTDPSLFFKGDVLGLGKFGKVTDLAVGVSARGQLPFTPKVTWGIEDQVKAMKGHLFVSGSVPLSKYPLSIDGDIVVNVDPDNTGKPAFSNATGGLAIAANGTVNVTIDYVPSLELSFPVVNATMGGKVTDTEQDAYFSGEADSDVKWIPTVIPLRPAGKVKVAGRVHSDVSKSFLKAEGKYTLATTMVNEWLDLGLSDVDLATAKMQIDKNGFRIQGAAATPIHAALAPKGAVQVDAFFSGSRSNWYAQMSGDFSVAGFPLGSASAKASPSGLFVTGSYTTPLSSVAMSGQITGAGPSLSGTAKVEIPIVAPKEVQQFMQHVSCGTTTVKDASKCGWDYGKNAAECGTSYVTSGAECGWSYISGGLECAMSGFSDCKFANSCNVANSCYFPKSCSVTNSCWVKTTDPAYDFGKFTGTVRITVGPRGASGSLQGQFCSSAGGCIPLPSARVELGGSPRACVSGVPGASGEFCASF